MQGLITTDVVPRPGTPEFWASLAVTGVGLGVYQKTAKARTVMSWIRHPIANYAVRHGSPMLARGAQAYLHTSKVIRYTGYTAFLLDPFATVYYTRRGEYDKAIIQAFGPPGSVYIYGKLVKHEAEESSRQIVSGGTRQKPSQMSQKQKKRLWRMGLRWCKKHGRYDKCSLRARR